ncbi:MAG: class I SAM-dependent methyltransferase [Akkermansiaceae bacterium]
MIQRLPFTFPGTAGDIERLGTLLDQSLRLSKVELTGPLSVLNLACGRADETGVLAAAVAPANIQFYLGMDLRSDAIAEAKKRWELPGGEIDFREGNAAMIGRMKHLPKFDLIFIRHQNYWNEPMVWEGILDEALAALKGGGYLVCTSYFDVEHQLLLASLREKEVELLSNIRHPFSRELTDAEGKSVDRWMGVFRRPD